MAHSLANSFHAFFSKEWVGRFIIMVHSQSWKGWHVPRLNYFKSFLKVWKCEWYIVFFHYLCCFYIPLVYLSNYQNKWITGFSNEFVILNLVKIIVLHAIVAFLVQEILSVHYSNLAAILRNSSHIGKIQEYLYLHESENTLD